MSLGERYVRLMMISARYTGPTQYNYTQLEYPRDPTAQYSTVQYSTVQFLYYSILYDYLVLALKTR